MSQRSDVPPDTLSVSLEPEGVEVEYTDGRVTFYHGVPERIEGEVVTPPGKEVHVLVTDPTETEGVLVYVNDRKTHEDILQDSGVGRVLVPEGETESLFPGVEVENVGHRVRLTADPEAVRGRVFVFAEDDVSEHAYEIVADEHDDGGDAGAGDGDGADSSGGWDD